MDELNILQKYLLVAAYIASFQSAKEDVKAFGSEVVVKRKSKHTRTLFNPAKAKENCDIKVRPVHIESASLKLLLSCS